MISDTTRALEVSAEARRLSEAEKIQFRKAGYVTGLPLFANSALATLQEQFHELAARLPADVDINRINNWHKASRWYYDFCRTPAILDYVEDLLGPNFVQWGGQFFVKYPGDGSVVPFHQDAQYWPLTPHKTVTVWVAMFDSDVQNGAMQVVRGSHHSGDLRHHPVSGEQYVLEQEADADQIDPSDVVSLTLKAGQMSLHDDGLLHGSPANNSERVRCGLTMRFCAPDVKCDLSVWPTFEVYPARGVDDQQLNPLGIIPEGEQFPVRRFQASAEFNGGP